MRKVLFSIVVTLFVALAIYCFVVGMLVDEKAPWFMASFTSLVALFTSLLWRATDKYAETTRELLRQSKETLEQSRIAFLVDIVDRTIEYAEKAPEPKVANQAKHIVNKSKAMKKISGERSLEFLDAMIDWSVGELTKILESYRRSPMVELKDKKINR